MSSSLRIAGLEKRFGDVEAVRGLDLSVQPNEVYGLIGPDGAGKTTTMRMIAGLITPDAGSIEVLGMPVPGKVAKVRRRVGYMPQQYSLYGDLSVRENLRFFAGMYGVRGAELGSREKRLLEIARLERFQERRAQALSGGMYKKLALSCALIHSPELLLLDEPTNGVDPISRRELWSFLYELVAEGVTVVVSTPYMDEAERCDRVGLMIGGALAAQGSPRRMREELDQTVFEITASPQGETMKVVSKLESLSRVYTVGKKVHALGRVDDDYGQKIGRALREAGVSVGRVERVDASFEDVFLHISSKAKSDARQG